MAASMRLTCSRTFNCICRVNAVKQVSKITPAHLQLQYARTFSKSTFQSVTNPWKRRAIIGLAAGTSAIGLSTFVTKNLPKSVTANTGAPPPIKPSRSIHSESDTTGLKLTLYQYQTCPFCCKVRAYLDFYGFSYDVVEVNSVWRTQTKWTKYPKVPILVCHGVGEDGFVQMNDSTVIISALDSLLEDRANSIDKVMTYYPGLESKNKKGKTVMEYPNKYFVMYGEKDIKTSTPNERKEERKWREWADSVFVHLISPNIYRSREEAMQAFRYFDKVGEWEQHFSSFERSVVIYVGATAMYFVGKMLKKKYELNDDVRKSLYDGCDEWMKAINKKKRTYMGGEKPNLADLAMYGVLSSMEGCIAFKDVTDNTNISSWYNNMKFEVEHHHGNQAR